jgi:hypothetical protein
VRQVRCCYSPSGRIVIKMGRPARGAEGAYLNRYVTDEQPGRRPIFIASLRVARLLAGLPRRIAHRFEDCYSPSPVRIHCGASVAGHGLLPSSTWPSLSPKCLAE